MMRNIALLFVLLLLTSSYNAAREVRSKGFTFLRSDRKLPGPSMLFNKSIASGVFQFEFKTFVNLALVLYQDDNGISDHIQVTIQTGRIYFSFYVNRNGTPGVGVTFKSNNTYNDFRWHSLRIERNSSYTSIVLDNGKEGEKFKTFGYQSRFVSNLLIGGFRDDQYANDLSNPSAFWLYVSPFSKRGFFNACVRNIKYGKTPRDMKEISNEYIEKNKVTRGCNLNYCHKPVPICKNNGKCKPDGKTKVSCDCLWTGFEGKYCDKDALELTLNGKYKVKHQFVSRAFAEEKYTFRIKTLQENAVLFYAKGPPNYADLVLIEIENSRLKMVFNPGGYREGDNFTLISEQKISDGKWHVVQYVKERKYYTLKVDAKTKRSGSFNVFLRMDYHTDSYLGEISKQPYKHEIKIQDFIWETGPKTKANFISGLFKTYQNVNEGFRVVPERALPNFNRALPSSTPRPMPNNHSSY